MADLKITDLGRGAFRVDDGSRARIGYVAGPADARWVFLDGYTYVVDTQPQDASRTRTRGHDEGALASPMPATVVKITVGPGQRVSKGDVLVVLEAMKMELAVKAPRDGAVKSLACKPGDLVAPGVPLLELE